MTAGEDMTPAQSPANSDSEEEHDELELSVAKLGLDRQNGGNSPANGPVEHPHQTAKHVGFKEETPSTKTGYELTAEDRAILERAAVILRGQVRHFEQEINANIQQRMLSCS